MSPIHWSFLSHYLLTEVKCGWHRELATQAALPQATSKCYHLDKLGRLASAAKLVALLAL